MTLRPLQRLHYGLRQVYQGMRGPRWFPQVPLGLLLGVAGLWLLQAEVGADWRTQLDALLEDPSRLDPRTLPPLIVGSGMLPMALGLLLRSRLAWVMAVLLTATAAVVTQFGAPALRLDLLGYFGLLLIALILARHRFDHSSLAAGSLFGFTAMAMLLQYATFGSYYLGSGFRPPVEDLVTGLYFSIETVSTVGYGDIIPHTREAQLFTMSIIVLGVAAFATSLTAVIAPMVRRGLQRIASQGAPTMNRTNHFVVIGNTSLATNTCLELARRGRPVTRILSEAPEVAAEASGIDFVVGDPSHSEVLRAAGAQYAEAVLAMLDDDSDNAFAVLAVRELRGSARTVAAVNDVRHLARVKLVQPDMVVAPQILGGELTAMLLSGEEVTPEFVAQRLFQPSGTAPDGEPSAAKG